ncbi:MAG: hypothetical protein J6D27_02315 [Ruminiclostridium sp.]|nr:hypothetical protein [Ruminiclostridium sp.]
MKNLRLTLAGLILLGSLTACSQNAVTSQSDSNSSTENSLISDPFQVEESKTESSLVESDTESTPVRPPSPNRGGFSNEVNGNMPITYKGGTLSVPIKVTAYAQNPMDISVGVTVFIDGIMQKLCVDGEETDGMYVIKSIKPGDYEKITLDIVPQITKGSESKAELPMHFVWHFNPDYSVDMKKPNLGNTHKSMPSPNTTLNVSEKIKEVIAYESTTEMKKIIITEDVQEQYRINSPEKTRAVFINQIGDEYAATQGLIKAGEDKKAEFEVGLSSFEHGKYRVTFYKNNKLISFNENETYIDVEAESGYLYLTDIAIEDISIGDIVHAIAIPYDYTKEDGYKSCMVSNPLIAVEDDFKFGA